MFGFVSLSKYKKLSDLRNREFCDYVEEIHKLNKEVCTAKEEVDKYKKFYVDELQSRLELAELVRNFKKGE